jgi:TolB-like protein/Tfp pilus assembly protein PilF
MSKPTQMLYEFGPFRLDVAERRLSRNGEPVSLAPKVFDTLLALVENFGRLVEKNELISRLWPDTFVEEVTLARNISVLRKALGESSTERRYVETVPKAGYRFVANVTQIGAGEGSVLVRRRTSSRVVVEEETDAAPALQSIAVLPFRLLAGTAGDEYLGPGLADALITRLSKIRRIRVRPTSAVLGYTGLTPDPVAAGQKLGVDSVLEGSIQSLDERVRVTVQLVSTQDGASLWAGKFDEKFTDIFAVEDSISEQVAAALMLRLTGEERKLLKRRYTHSTEAYQLYLRGRYFWYKRTEQGMRKGIDYFNQAIEEDPAYAAAYDGLSDSYTMLAIRGIISPKEGFAKAKAAARRALEIDDTLGEAHASLAHVRLHDFDWPGLEDVFKRAIEMNPTHAIAYHWYAEYLGAMKRFDEAILMVKQALQLEPLSPVISLTLAGAYDQARRPDEAIAELRKGLELDPNHSSLRAELAEAYAQKGMYEEAIDEMQRAVSLSGRSTERLAGLAQVYAAAGKRDRALEILGELNQLPKDRYVSPYCVAMAYAALDENDKAFAYLEEAYEERNPNLIELNTEPAFDRLRQDRRYEELVQRIGLVP